MSDWISVKERLPERDGRYLVAIKNGDGYSISVRKFRNGGFGYKNGVWERRTFGVRFWMHLPKPPEATS